MTHYIDGFAFPIKQSDLNEYKRVAKTVAKIWKEHGALAYYEFVGDDLHLEGTRSFPEALGAQENETIVFGWVMFESRDSRDRANKLVMEDPRMADLLAPLTKPSKIIFDPSKMIYGGFQSFIEKGVGDV